ncbi:Lsr2 dimerization domain-containing protein [Microbispora bryophytorum]|uniref:Lsr2 dimerization domain-containing protein n=1 Tax=Microbispora bryophytorum TaxID=1460882 RepID=UPI001E30D514|nr:histone-like nucleoid-structuring protein Lsr2 [Microbispora bryophytorum]
MILVDDLDHSEGDDVARREFPLLNRTFSIDLSDANQQRLSEALAFIDEVLENAREVKQASRAKKAADASPRLRGYTQTDVREWAREQGLDVPARGKMSDEVVEQFIAAHPDASPDAGPDAAAEDSTGESAADHAEASAGAAAPRVEAAVPA